MDLFQNKMRSNGRWNRYRELVCFMWTLLEIRWMSWSTKEHKSTRGSHITFKTHFPRTEATVSIETFLHTLLTQPGVHNPMTALWTATSEHGVCLTEFCHSGCLRMQERWCVLIHNQSTATKVKTLAVLGKERVLCLASSLTGAVLLLLCERF